MGYTRLSCKTYHGVSILLYHVHLNMIDPLPHCQFAGKYMYRISLISCTIIKKVPIFQMINLERIPVLYLCKCGVFICEVRIAEPVMHYNLPSIRLA
jgi:hypothetical protein